jgi:hypothetical protein
MASNKSGITNAKDMNGKTVVARYAKSPTFRADEIIFSPT